MPIGATIHETSSSAKRMNTTFPRIRMRRNRSHDFVRRMVREHDLTVNDLIYPMFVVEGKDTRQPVDSMPKIERLSIDQAVLEAEHVHQLGLPAVALFPFIHPDLKDDRGSEATSSQGLIPRAISAVKSQCPELGVVTDAALDPYTDHGQDGLLDSSGDVDNDATLTILVEQARVCANAGSDVIAPSDMMDGRVGEIRDMLEAEGHVNTKIMAYSAKYASSFYGPFRNAVGSAATLGQGHKRSYQMDVGNSDEALREIALDIEEGADMVMVKPGLPYLDVVRRAKEAFAIPLVVYQVSGEYSMIMAAIENGWLPATVILETLLCMKRAGADAVLTYFAKHVAQVLART